MGRSFQAARDGAARDDGFERGEVGGVHREVGVLAGGEAPLGAVGADHARGREAGGAHRLVQRYAELAHDDGEHAVEQRAASREGAAVGHHADALVHLVGHRAHREARAVGEAGAAGGVGDEAEPVRAEGLPGERHQRGREVLAVGDHLAGERVRCQRGLEQPRSPPRPLAHRGRLPAPQVDDVAQPPPLAALEDVVGGRRMPGGRHDAVRHQPARELLGAGQFGREADQPDRVGVGEQGVDRPVVRVPQVVRVLRAALGGGEVGALDVGAEHLRAAPGSPRRTRCIGRTRLIGRTRFIGRHPGAGGGERGQDVGEGRRRGGREQRGHAAPRLLAHDRLEGKVVAVEERAPERAVGVDVHQAREQERAREVAPLDVRADVAVAADRFDAPAGDQQHAVVGHAVGQHQAAAAPRDAARGGPDVRSAHELATAEAAVRRPRLVELADARQVEVFGEVAGDEVPGSHLAQGRRLARARLHGVGAARVEVAAGRRVRGVRDLARQPLERGAQVGVGHRDGLHEGRGVRVLGAVEQRLGRRQFHQLADVHDRHAVADVLDDAQIVRDEQVREVELASAGRASGSGSALAPRRRAPRRPRRR